MAGTQLRDGKLIKDINLISVRFVSGADVDNITVCYFMGSRLLLFVPSWIQHHAIFCLIHKEDVATFRLSFSTGSVSR